MAPPRSITLPVGTRNGVTPQPNLPADLRTITELFDRIPFRNGGTNEIGGLWATERFALIAEVTAQIVTFQTTNSRPVIDGVVDPHGGTLNLMNQLALSGPPQPGGDFIASVVANPLGLQEEFIGRPVQVATVPSLPGNRPLEMAAPEATYVRRLVQCTGSSIKWYGVVMPGVIDGTFGSMPHINFTPTPIQGGYSDASYDSFGGWGQLWEDYTSMIGGQMAAAGVDQVLVIPFYKTSQSGRLGSFLQNWREVVSAVVTAAIDSADPTRLRDKFEFDRIVSSSFSNGYVAHQQFNTQGFGVASSTDFIFDLDGQAGGSTWRPPNGVIYLNRGSPLGVNPVAGMHWYVGGRWANFAPLYGGFMSTHANCRNHLLFHGLSTFCQELPIL